MVSKLFSELEAKLKREFEADWTAYKQRKLETREAELEREYLEALEGFKENLKGFDRWWPNDNGDHAELQHDVTPPMQETSPDQQEDRSSPTVGSPKNQIHAPTIRQMMQGILPELSGKEFLSSDVRAKILQEWPEAEDNSKHLPSRISQILKQMVENGQLEIVRRGEHVQDPIVYRVKEDERSNY